jgi:hypothetical protein
MVGVDHALDKHHEAHLLALHHIDNSKESQEELWLRSLLLPTPDLIGLFLAFSGKASSLQT